MKAALNLLGHEVGGLRLPLVEADAEQTATVAAALEAAGIQLDGQGLACLTPCGSSRSAGSARWART